MLGHEQLLCFVTTVEEGSFSGAARRLGKVQSAVSQQVINMEIDCGHQLFDRTGRYPALTAEGERLLPYAKAVLGQQHRLNQQVSLLGQIGPASLTLAYDEGIPEQQLLRLLTELPDAFPGLKVEILSAASSDIIEMTRTGRVGAGLVFSEALYPEGMDFESIGSVRFEPVVASHHPLAKRTLAHIDELKLHRQLVIGARGQHRSFLSEPHSPDAWYADNYFVLMTLVQQGLGWALLPKHLVERDLLKGNMQRLPISFESLGWQANVDIIQHHSLSMSPLGQHLRTALRLK
ncbi:LysR family transcriptional regulator [Shewanella sp. 3B26]|uniref:LysR family transcriptional regulator n=1 Tax=Shewanella zhuhaiensis TaxID=2919576 RepID=A0AAJ1F1F8_9GAMM|nr:LysR family transcriptional regulator [Shewanella zhuhaiensis]MCH4295537.1 LysR family transcriptional regulator [Shewanella zhuhaiensis]